MKFRIACAILPALLIAACGSKSGTAADGNGNGVAPAAAPVAAVKPVAGQSWVDIVSRTPEGGYRMGNPDAAVKLVEYGSRSCPHCAAFDAEGVSVLKAGPIAAGKLSYEFRDYPVHGALDMGPILLGQCVEPATFFPMLEQMFAAQQQLLNKPEMPRDQQAALQTRSPSQVATALAEYYGFLDFVKQRGVPEAKARACLADPKAIEAIAKSTETANDEYKVAGTPTFIVNGTVAQDVAEWEKLKPILQGAGAL